MNRLSIRWRITLSSVGAVLIVLVAAFFLTHWQVSRILVASNTDLAAADLNSFATDIVTNKGEHADSPATGVLVYICSPQGAVQQDTMPADIRSRVAQLATASGSTEVRADGTEYQLVGESISTSRGTWNLWAARSNASIPAAVARVDVALALGLTALLLLLSIASYAIASAALRPVARLRAAAESLAVESAATPEPPQLPVGRARDEINSLAETLNGFLGDIHAANARERHMVSDAAHELRTPLAVLRTQLELAHDHSGDSEALEREITRAESSVTRLAALASNLLELSRLEAGEVVAGSSTTDELSDEVLAAVDRARLLAASRHIEIGFEIDPAMETGSVALDTVAIARILDNLLSNAVAAVDPDTGDVEVRVHSHPGHTVIDVIDNGHGMPAEFIDRAFDRFSRPDVGRSSREGGAGLGLSLVQGISHSAGGTAHILPQDRGVIVRVTLPNIR